MKEKIFSLDVETDVTSIQCDLYAAKLIISQADDEIFKVEYPDAKNLHVACGDGGIIISQGRPSLFALAKQTIKVFVPAHTMPTLKLSGKKLVCEMLGGIYGELNLTVSCGVLDINGAAFESVEILGGMVNTRITEATVRGSLFVQINSGNVLAENTFATHMECRVKHGNIGLVRINCKECVFEAESGNISATVAGAEENFNTTLLSKTGTVNRESAQHQGADNSFNAYTNKGNIVLDYVDSKEAV